MKTLNCRDVGFDSERLLKAIYSKLSMLTRVMLFALILIWPGLTSFAQTRTIEKTITPPQTIYESGEGRVQIQFLLFPCDNKLSDRKYGFYNTLYSKGGYVSGKFDYELCAGGTHTEDFTVYLNKVGEIRSDGAWILNTNRVLQVYDVKFHDPEATAREREEEQRQANERRETEARERERRDRLEEEQREREAEQRRQREEQTRQANEADQRLQNAANQNSDPVTKAMYEANRRNAEAIRDPQERQQFLNQHAQLAEQSARSQQAIDGLSKAATDLASIEVDDLAESDMLVVLGGGISNLASPYFVSNRTTTSAGNPTNWFLNMGILNRTGLSFLFSMGSLNQVNDKFVVYTTATNGNSYAFDGKLNAKATQYQFSLGKDLFSKNGRFHAFLGGSVGYLSLDNHDWTQGSNKFSEAKIGDGAWYGGLNGQVFVFFSQRLGLNVGANYNLFFKKVEDTRFYQTNNPLIWNAGLTLRPF